MTDASLSAPRRADRLALVDLLRGLMIALMALDHVREYFHNQALLFQPTDLDQTTPELFATRWITHLCAPTFVFLSGVSIWLQRENGKTGWSLSRFLMVRGLWLILLELTVIALALDFRLPFVFLQVIWAIGAGMILMALMVHLPRGVVLGVGVAILAGYQAAAMALPQDKGDWQLLWTLMVQPGLLAPVSGMVAYPALPWFAFMAIGYGAAPVFGKDPNVRDRWLLGAGAALLAAFAVLRGLNGYGDFRPWAVQDDAVRTILSFLNVSKYPPSLAFGLVTLGVSLVLAPALARLTGPVARMLLAFGRTPLFTYVLHLYLIHAAALLTGVLMGVPASAFVGFLSDNAVLVERGWGVGLVATYGVWIVLLVAMWPLASRYAAFRARNRRWWTSYL